MSIIKSDLTRKTIEIVLTEGRNRQIRRVAQQLGYQVKRLHRLAIGSINLMPDKGELLPGQYRHLRLAEINYLQNSLNFKPVNVTAHLGSAVYDKK